MVKVKENLTGKKFGRLLVIEQAEDKIRPDGTHIAMWKCLCDCQADKDTPSYVYKEGVELKRGNGLSCGCYNLEKIRERQTKDLTNKKFGRLTTIRLSHYRRRNGYSYAVWECICDCQKGLESPNFTYVEASSLISGNTTSCGCYHKEKLLEALHARKTENRYEKQNGYYIGYTSNDEPFYFDESDFELVRKYKWFFNANGYVTAHREDDVTIFMHRLIMGLEKGDPREVDHILGHGTENDNRRYNLRVVTSSQNQMNRRKQSNNTSGVVGVWFECRRNKWCAEIMVNKKKFYLGLFEKKEDAEKARQAAENILHGDFSYRNSQLIGNERLQLFEKLYGANYSEDGDIEKNIS